MSVTPDVIGGRTEPQVNIYKRSNDYVNATEETNGSKMRGKDSLGLTSRCLYRPPAILLR